MAEDQKKVKLSEQQLMNIFSSERGKLENIQSDIAMTQSQLLEIAAATDALNAIKKSQEKEKIIVPVGAGVYIDALVESNANAKASMAGGIVANMTIDEALKILAERKEGTGNSLAEMQKAWEKVSANLESISRLLSMIEQKKQQQAQAK